jgi:adenylate cyclase
VSRPRAARPDDRATFRVRAYGVAILAALAVAIALAESWNGRLQEAGLDRYQAFAPRRVESMPAVVVEIDERSLAALGQWPWPRTTLARLVRAIDRNEPAAIGIDLLMPEPDHLSPEKLLERVEFQAPALARELAALPQHDEELARALAATRSVLGVAGSFDATGMTLRAPPVVVQGSDAGAIRGLTRYAGVTTSIDALDRAAAGHGVLSVDPSYGVIRRIPLVVDVGGTLAPSLAIEMLRVAGRVPTLRLLADGGRVRGIAVGDLVAPTEGDGAVRPYYSPRDARRFVAAVDVLDGRVDPERLRHKLVIVAASGLGLVDYQNTPPGYAMPGSEIHAQLLENLFDGTLLTRPRWARAGEVALFLAAGSLLVFAMPVWPPRRAAVLATGSLFLPAAVGWVAFRSQHWLFDAVTPTLGLALLSAALLLLTLAEADRRRKALESQLQRQREREARVAGELDAARRIQTGMLPRADLLREDRRLDLAAAMVPAREVGGDLYDYFMRDHRRLFLMIGDVAGKGLSASIFMAVSKALYKSATLRMADADVGELMQAANAEVSRDNPEALFVTAFAAILDLDTGELAYCNAGHDNPYVLQPGSPTLARLPDGDGPPLCAVDGFPYLAARRMMRPGDVLCLVTDGVTEARDSEGALYGNARLHALLAGCATTAAAPQALVDAVRASVTSFAGDAEAADDLTVLAVRWNGPPIEAARR